MRKLLIGLPLLLMACASSERYVEREPFLYRLDSGDVVRLTVFRRPDLSGEYRVDGRGIVDIPAVGSIPVEASTQRELEEKIEEGLMDSDPLLDPQVVVEVTSHRPFYVMGSVNNPGRFEYVDGMTVLDALAMAGGLDHRGVQGSVLINNNDAFVGYATYDTPVYPGDVITVAERFF